MSLSINSGSQSPSLAYAYGGPTVKAAIKQQAEDFYVDEILGFEPSGTGEHVFLHIEKRCLTTLAVRDAIAKLAGCKLMDVGYSGLKDKWAVTRQWFSVYLPVTIEPNWSELLIEAQSSKAYLRVLRIDRHDRKLRRGTHKENAFKLALRDVGNVSDSRDLSMDAEHYFNQRLTILSEQGFPNYFGQQRFSNQNLVKARQLFDANKRMPREQRGLCLSAARSYLFNLLLSERVRQDNWTHYLAGDVLMLAGSRSQFSLHEGDADWFNSSATDELMKLVNPIEERLSEADIHISGTLCGLGESPLSAVALELETAVLRSEQALVDGLCRQGVEQARRPLRAMPKQLKWQFKSEKLQLSFVLPTGSYATVLLRELVEC